MMNKNEIREYLEDNLKDSKLVNKVTERLSDINMFSCILVCGFILSLSSIVLLIAFFINKTLLLVLICLILLIAIGLDYYGRKGLKEMVDEIKFKRLN